MKMNNYTGEPFALNQTTELSRLWRPAAVVSAIITIIIMLVGLFGNMLTIVALIKSPKVRNVAAAFIISLCIADFIFCILVLPFAVSDFSNGGWIYNHGVLCKLVPFIRYGNVGVSLLSIALITINRYIMIAHHTIYSRIYTKTNIGFMIAFSWIFSYGMQIPTLLGVWGAFAYDEKWGSCSIKVDSHGRSSKTVLFVMAFLVPAALIVVCYARIFWVVHSSEKRMREHRKKQNSSSRISDLNTTMNSTTTINNIDKKPNIKDKESKAKRNEWRITKMVLAIFLSFLVCYLPITIVKIADNNATHPYLHLIGYLLLYASACINPIIYVIMNSQYRAAYAATICCSSIPLLPSVGAYDSPTNHRVTFAQQPTIMPVILVVEKWKDRESYNNTRTALSQVSLGDTVIHQPEQGVCGEPNAANSV